MSVLVLGAGRSGTNMVLEILAGNPAFHPTEPPEDKWVFERPNGFLDMGYIDTYLSKSDTHYCSSYYKLKQLLEENQTMKIVWTIRDPRDMCLSKINRGWKRQSDDATLAGCIADMYHMWDLYTRVIVDFPDRVYLIKMEDIILDTTDEIKKLCVWVGIRYIRDMEFFYKRMRHQGKKKRYNKIDKGQVGMYLNDEYMQSIINGCDINISSLFHRIGLIVTYFKYDEA